MNRIKLTVYIVSAAWSVALLVAGIHLPGTETKVLGYLPIVIVGIFAVFDQWVWRWTALRRLVRVPNLNGTWRGELTSMWPNDKGVEVTHEPKPIFLSIKQSYLTVSITLMSDESSSESFAAVLQPEGADRFAIHYHYRNRPGLAVRDRSRPHDGAAKIAVSGLSPTSQTGEYWTDRRSRGTWTAQRISNKRVGDYAAAVAAFGLGE